MPPSWRMALNDPSGLGQAQRPSKACTSYGSFLSVSLFRNWARMVFHYLNDGPNPSPIANKKVPYVLFSFVTSSSQPNQNTRGTHENTFAINSRGSTGAATRFFISLGPSVQFFEALAKDKSDPFSFSLSLRALGAGPLGHPSQRVLGVLGPRELSKLHTFSLYKTFCLYQSVHFYQIVFL